MACSQEFKSHAAVACSVAQRKQETVKVWVALLEK